METEENIKEVFYNNKSEHKRGCLFIFFMFLSSCFAITVLIIVLAVFLLSGFFKSLTDKSSDTDGLFREAYYSGNIKSNNKIALLNIHGIILNNQTPWYDTANSNEICKKLDLILKDKNIKAVILDIDSPGGEITATDKIHHKIKQIKKAGKPVIALLDSLATSGGYYIAVAANYIVANRLTTTGSIGVIINSFNFYKLLQKIGVSDEVYKSKEMKDILNPARPRTKAEKKILQNLVKESYNEFVQVVSEGRILKDPKLTENHIKNSVIGDGRIFSGSQALKLGLIDELGYFDEAEQKAASLTKLSRKNYKIITYKENLSIFRFLQKVYYDNSNINVNLNGIKTYSLAEPGKLYFLYTGL